MAASKIIVKTIISQTLIIKKAQQLVTSEEKHHDPLIENHPRVLYRRRRWT